MTEPIPSLESCGFIRVPTDGSDELWLTCEACSKSDHFWISGSKVHCRCGAEYSHANRPDGSTVPVPDLEFVPWGKGPRALADTEIDPLKLAILAILGVIALGGLGTAIWWYLT